MSIYVWFCFANFAIILFRGNLNDGVIGDIKWEHFLNSKLKGYKIMNGI